MGTPVEELGEGLKELKGIETPPELPGTTPPTKEYIWMGLWLQLHK